MSDKSKLIPMSDDEIMKRKLLIDGDGIGDDRRITIALKQFVRWCLMDTDDTPEERVLGYEKILMTLSQCELSMIKSEQTLRMMCREMNNYDTLYEKVDKSIVDCQQKIIRCKEELIEAKRVRKNKCEYESMAAVINRHSDRIDTMTRLQDLEQEIKRLQQTKDQMLEKLEKRRKQFHVLLGAAHQLNQILNEESENNEVLTTVADDKSEKMDIN